MFNVLFLPEVPIPMPVRVAAIGLILEQTLTFFPGVSRQLLELESKELTY